MIEEAAMASLLASFRGNGLMEGIQGYLSPHCSHHAMGSRGFLGPIILQEDLSLMGGQAISIGPTADYFGLGDCVLAVMASTSPFVLLPYGDRWP